MNEFNWLKLILLHIRDSMLRNTIQWDWFLKRAYNERQGALTIFFSFLSRWLPLPARFGVSVPFVRTKRPPRVSWEPRNNYYEKKKFHLRLQPLFVDRIIFKDPAPVRCEDGMDRRKRGDIYAQRLCFFLSVL